MKNSTRGLVAGGLGVALLAGGATFALWSDSAEVDNGTITAGNLDVEAGDRTWLATNPDYDSSNPAEGTEPYTEVDIDTFRTVPGDSLQLIQKVDIELEGDNLDAELNVSLPDVPGDNDFLSETYGLSGTYTLYGPEGRYVGESSGAGRVGGRGIELVGMTPDDSGEYTVVVTLSFSSNWDHAQARTNTEASVDLGDMVFDLKQAKPTA